MDIHVACGYFKPYPGGQYLISMKGRDTSTSDTSRDESITNNNYGIHGDDKLK